MRRYLWLALAGMLAVPLGTPPRAQGGFDGTWDGRGTLTANRGRGTDCGPETLPHRLTVQGGVVSWAYSQQANIRFQGAIGADGSVSLVSGQSRFTGRFAGNGMAGTFSHPSCERSWQFRRQAR